MVHGSLSEGVRDNKPWDKEYFDPSYWVLSANSVSDVLWVVMTTGHFMTVIRLDVTDTNWRFPNRKLMD